MVGEISHFEFDAYHVTLPGAIDLKKIMGGVLFNVREESFAYLYYRTVDYHHGKE